MARPFGVNASPIGLAVKLAEPPGRERGCLASGQPEIQSRAIEPDLSLSRYRRLSGPTSKSLKSAHALRRALSGRQIARAS